MKEYENLKVVVQIGANCGYDDITDIIRGNKDTIKKFVAVEPMIEHHKSLKECYSDIENFYIDNSAVVNDSTQSTISFFYDANDGPQYEIASLSPSHIKKHIPSGREDIKEIKVPCVTINGIFEKYKLDNIDLLAIDVEGHDLDLLMDIDFEKVNINCIIYEHIHIDANITNTYLNDRGYEVRNGGGPGNLNSLAIKNADKL